MSKQFVALSEIVIESRQRKEFPERENQNLQQSIQNIGLLQAPVLEEVDGRFILRAGERRVRAVKDLADFGQAIRYNGQAVELGFIPYTSWKTLTPYQRLQIEVDENQQRIGFSWQEAAAAMSKLAELRVLESQINNTPAPTTRNLAIEAYVTGDKPMHPTAALDRAKTELILAKHLNNPAVAAAKTAKEALQILRNQERTKANTRLAEITGGLQKSERFKLHYGDAKRWAGEQEPQQFDVILTDPPYGMGADNFGTAEDGSATAHSYADTAEVLDAILAWFPDEAFRLAKEQAHLYVFCDLDKFYDWKHCLTEAGWTVFRTPLIWVKPTGFRTPWIDSGPQRKYELIVYAKKGGKKVNMVAGDVIQIQSPGAGLGHPAAKPPAVFVELLRRSVRPGDKIWDPFCGTGPIFTAAHQMNCFAVGNELMAEYYGQSLKTIEILEG